MRVEEEGLFKLFQSRILSFFFLIRTQQRMGDENRRGGLKRRFPTSLVSGRMPGNIIPGSRDYSAGRRSGRQSDRGNDCNPSLSLSLFTLSALWRDFTGAERRRRARVPMTRKSPLDATSLPTPHTHKNPLCHTHNIAERNNHHPCCLLYFRKTSQDVLKFRVHLVGERVALSHPYTLALETIKSFQLWEEIILN